MDTDAWLRGILSNYRTKSAHLTEQAHRRIQVVSDLRAPCQLTVFEFTDPTWQAIIVTHSRIAPDGQIQVVRPRGWELFETFDRLLADPLWSDELAEDGHTVRPSDPAATLRWVGDQLMIAVFRQFQSSHLRKPHLEHSRFMQMSLFGSRCALWVHYGAISDYDMMDFLDRELVEVQQEPPPPLPQNAAVGEPAAAPTPRKYAGHGAFCSPRRTVGRLSGISIAERYFREHYLPGRPVHRGRVGGLDVLITHAGYVGVLTPNRSEALSWLNLIAAGFSQLGFPTYAFRDQDVGGFHPPDDETGHPMWGGEFPNARGQSLDSPGGLPEWHTHWVSIEDMTTALDRATTLSAKPYAADLPLLLEAQTHLANQEYTPSLVFSWAVIERAIGRRWRDFLQGKAVKGKREDKLLNTAIWTIDAVVETLDLSEPFPTELYASLDATRRARNEVFHGDRVATPSEAERAIRVADRLLTGADEAVLAKPRPTPIGEAFL